MSMKCKNLNKSQSQELLHCFLFEPSIYISIVSVIKGDVTEEEIKLAVEKAYTRNETTMSKVVLENGNAYFEHMQKTGCKAFIDKRDWRDILNESEKDTFRINEGELFRTYIIPNQDKQEYTIFMMAHHIAGDGKSLLLLLEDILTILSGNNVDYRYLDLEGAIRPQPGLKYPAWLHALIKYLNRMWKKEEKVFDWEDYFEIHRQFWNSRKSDVRLEALAPEKLEEIKIQCKEMGITMNSYMVTDRLSKHPEYKSFCVLLSLKGENRSISNQVAILNFEYQYNTRKSFKDNAKQVHKLIQSHLEQEDKRYFVYVTIGRLNPNLLDATLMDTFTEYKNKVAGIVANIMGYQGNRKTDVSITNLTNINIPSEYERFQLENVFGVAACMSATKNVICIGSYQGKMSIVYSDIIKEK